MQANQAAPRALYLTKRDEDGSATYFSTSQSGTTAPTLIVDSITIPPSFRTGIIRRIHYRLNPTNAVTYTLRLWIGTTSDTYNLNMYKLYESPAAQADDTEYDREVEIPFLLSIASILYYSIEWSAAPGVTPGYIHLTGEAWET